MKLVPQRSVRKSAVSLACRALACVYLVHTYAYAPRAEDTRSRESRLRALVEENRESEDNPGPDKPGLAQALESYELLIEQLETRIPSGDEVPGLMEAIAAAERRAGVEMTMLRPEPPESHEPYETWSYQLAVRGGYHAIGAFITAIGSLNHVVATDDMIIAAESTAADVTRPGQVTVVASFRMRLRVKTKRGAVVPD